MTHEPHFCLLREVVSFTGGGRGQPAREVLDNPCQEHFVLLQIGWVGGLARATQRSAAPLASSPTGRSVVVRMPRLWKLLIESLGLALSGSGRRTRHGKPPSEQHACPGCPRCSLLRDYFDAEFRTALADGLPFAYDLERVVDDFVLFCMLVGNDFLPPLPTVDINEGEGLRLRE